VSVEQALDWVDAHASRLEWEEIALHEAIGRIPAAPVACPTDLPVSDCAAIDGYAVRSEETIGAGSYNPLSFANRPSGENLPRGSATLVLAGIPLPLGANAVLPFEGATESGMELEVCTPVPHGYGINRRGQEIGRGSTVVDGTRPLTPQDIGLLAGSGIDRLRVLRRPQVALIIAGPKSRNSTDTNGPMLRALILRDGGVVHKIESWSASTTTLALALADIRADVILVAGRTGTGPDDISPIALAAAGTLDIHGIALRPGGSAGIGRIDKTPVILLPGDPLAAFCAYDMFAGRLIRSMGGHDPRLPYPVIHLWIKRKIVSEVGQVDIVRVRTSGHVAEPVCSEDSGGLASVARADGFVVIPATLEGFPPGARVPVYLYNPAVAFRLSPSGIEAF
jgi:molybdopterin molybdotransferase